MHHQQHRGLLGIGRQVQIDALLLVAAIGQVALDLCVRCLALGSPFLQFSRSGPALLNGAVSRSRTLRKVRNGVLCITKHSFAG